MYTSIVQFDLATRDQHIDNIKQQIKKKQLFLTDCFISLLLSIKNICFFLICCFILSIC